VLLYYIMFKVRNTGLKGNQGFKGSQGVKGEKGNIGNTGATGLRGATGAHGVPGTNFEGGAVYTRWGRTNCSASSTILYKGLLVIKSFKFRLQIYFNKYIVV